ncbi:MAG: DUF177 domain-containing protein [Nitrospiraceae bacterium]
MPVLERVGSATMERNDLTYTVSEILADGLHVDETLTGTDLDLSQGDTPITGALHLRMDLSLDDAHVSVQGTITGETTRQCVRCLKEFIDPLAVRFAADYFKKQAKGRKLTRQASGDTSEPEATGGASEDAYEYSGDEIDLVPMLREQVILAEPMHPLCREECLGLCPVCGRDRNMGACGCHEPSEGNLAEKIRSAQRSLKRS